MLIHTKQVFRGKYFSTSAAVNWQEVYFLVVYYKINFESDNFGDTSKNVFYLVYHQDLLNLKMYAIFDCDPKFLLQAE